MSLILRQVEDGAAIITLNHDARRNALSRALIDELIVAFEEIKSARARSVILRAHPGAVVWSAGHDVSELPGPGRDPLGYEDPLRRVVRAIEMLPLPVIAMIEGSVWGGACELAVTCDLVIATPDATFALTPARLGVPYNTAGIQNMMDSISTRLLKEMLFTARPISSERALQLGMINHVVPAAEFESFTRRLTDQLAETAPACVGLLKEEMRILLESRPMSAETFERLQGLRRRIYDGHDYQEGIGSFLEKRKPLFTGD